MNLDGCSLENAHLSGAHLAEVCLNHAKLDGVDLEGADLYGAFLQNAKMRKVNLTKAVLDEAHMEQAELHFVGKVMDSVASGSYETDYYVSRIREEGADLEGVSLKGAHLNRAILAGANLDRADLREASMGGSILIAASLKGADLRGSDFNDELGIRRRRPSHRADLCAADLQKANLAGARLEGVNLVWANLKEAVLDRAKLYDAQLGWANLNGVSFEEATILRADFENANLDEAYLKRAIFDKETVSSLNSASLRGACLDDDQIKQAAEWGFLELKEKTTRNGIHRLLKTSDKEQILKNNNNISDRLLNIRKGMTVAFGRYPQDIQNESGLFVPEPLLWRVLEVDEKERQALLITERLIDCKEYHERWEDITWENCTLRQWMNDDFIRQAFTTEELSLIVRVWNENPDKLWKTRIVDGGNVTMDRIFALRMDEVNRKDYFSNRGSRITNMTRYAKHKTMYETNMGLWWLRSPGNNGRSAALVLGNGEVREGGDYIDSSSVCVRPALWLNLESEIF